MIDYSFILSTFYVGKEWSLNGDNYENLVWHDSSEKPSKEELDNLWPETQNQMAKNACKRQAKILLAQTDWSILPDVEFVNKQEFLNYRFLVRDLLINPVANPSWPSLPKVIWK